MNRIINSLASVDLGANMFNNAMKTVKPTVLSAIIAAGLSMGSVAHAAPSFQQKTITQVGWSLAFVGSSYDAATNTTTFTYELTASSSEKDLSHWVLALGDAPLSSSGCNDDKFGLDPTTGVYGWKCDDGQDAGSIQTYTITVSGHVGEANTDYSVKGGTYYAVGSTTGPGAPIVSTATFSISGVAYLDMNGNGSRDADEPLLTNVSVNLSDGQSVKTDGTGNYSFSNLLSGKYSITVPEETATVFDDFNESLSQYFIPTTVSTMYVSVGPNAINQDFGFGIDTLAVLDDFDAVDPDGDGFTFGGTGKTIGFWKHQITSAKQGKTKGVQVSAAVVNDYLFSGTTSIKNLFIDVFGTIPTTTPGAYDYALGILASTSSNEVDLLKKQLFGTELNYQAGWGLNDMNLQGVLLAGFEYQVKYAASFSRDELLTAKDICDLINNTGE